MIKGDYLSESLLKEIFQITIQIREFEFATQTVDNLFKFSAQNSDLKYFFGPLQTFWQKATFSCMVLLYWLSKMYFEWLLLAHCTVTLKIAKFRFSWFWCLKSAGLLFLNEIRFISNSFFDGFNFWNTLFSEIVSKIFCLCAQVTAKNVENILHRFETYFYFTGLHWHYLCITIKLFYEAYSFSYFWLAKCHKNSSRKSGYHYSSYAGITAT